MRGARRQIERALTMREQEGRVTVDSWSEVQNASGKLADVQGYALLQLEAIAEKLENKTKIGGLARTAEETKPEVQKWLAVLADCFQLQDAFDVLVLDRALGESPEALDARRRGLQADRQDRLDLISRHTEHLLARMDLAVGRANAKMVWTWTKSLAVVESGNQLAVGVHDFHELLGIKADPRSWEARQLAPVAEMGAQAIQKTKETAPLVAAAVAVAALGVGKAMQERGTTEES